MTIPQVVVSFVVQRDGGPRQDVESVGHLEDTLRRREA